MAEIPMELSRTTSMLNLNDDCLLEIMNYLPLSDIFNCGKTCQRLQKISLRAYGRFEHLDAKDFLTNNNKLKTIKKMSLLVMEVAQYVKSFKMSRKIYSMNGLLKCRALIILVLYHCHNIIELKIEFCIHDGRSLREICALGNFRKLETIEIQGNIKLHNLSKLKNLTLKTDNDLNITPLLRLTNLQTLCLHLPMELNSDLFLRFCENNPGLKRISLNILTDTLINIMFTKLRHLEDLTLPPKHDKNRYTFSGIHKITKIKSLKSLAISQSIPLLLCELAHIDQLESLTCTARSSVDTYKIKYFTKLKYLRTTILNGTQLIALKSQQTLQHLDISETNYLIDNQDIITFVRGATNLKCLIIYKCNGLNEDLLRMLSDIFQAGPYTHKLTVVCDLIRKRDAANYVWLNVIVRKTVRFS